MRILQAIRNVFRPPPSGYTKDLPQYAGYDIGEWTYGKPTILNWREGTTLRTGRFCSIARDVKVLVGGEHRLDWVTTYPFAEMWAQNNSVSPHKTSRSKGDVVIQNDVWIGTGSLILSGVTIGNGAVVGAGSVVTRNVPSYGIVAGNPARLLRLRFDPAIIQQLERIAWWDWPPSKIVEAWPLLMSSGVHAFVEKYGASSPVSV